MGFFAFLLAFTACEKKPITPVSSDDPFLFIEDDGDGATRDGNHRDPISGGGDPPPPPPPPSTDGDDEIEDPDGGIVDPDEDEDDDDDDDGK